MIIALVASALIITNYLFTYWIADRMEFTLPPYLIGLSTYFFVVLPILLSAGISDIILYVVFI